MNNSESPFNQTTARSQPWLQEWNADDARRWQQSQDALPHPDNRPLGSDTILSTIRLQRLYMAFNAYRRDMAENPSLATDTIRRGALRREALFLGLPELDVIPLMDITQSADRLPQQYVNSMAAQGILESRLSARFLTASERMRYDNIFNRFVARLTLLVEEQNRRDLIEEDEDRNAEKLTDVCQAILNRLRDVQPTASPASLSEELRVQLRNNVIAWTQDVENAELQFAMRNEGERITGRITQLQEEQAYIARLPDRVRTEFEASDAGRTYGNLNRSFLAWSLDTQRTGDEVQQIEEPRHAQQLAFLQNLRSEATITSYYRLSEAREAARRELNRLRQRSDRTTLEAQLVFLQERRGPMGSVQTLLSAEPMSPFMIDYRSQPNIPGGGMTLEGVGGYLDTNYHWITRIMALLNRNPIGSDTADRVLSQLDRLRGSFVAEDQAILAAGIRLETLRETYRLERPPEYTAPPPLRGIRAATANFDDRVRNTAVIPGAQPPIAAPPPAYEDIAPLTTQSQPQPMTQSISGTTDSAPRPPLLSPPHVYGTGEAGVSTPAPVAPSHAEQQGPVAGSSRIQAPSVEESDRVDLSWTTVNNTQNIMDLRNYLLSEINGPQGTVAQASLRILDRALTNRDLVGVESTRRYVQEVFPDDATRAHQLLPITTSTDNTALGQILESSQPPRAQQSPGVSQPESQELGSHTSPLPTTTNESPDDPELSHALSDYRFYSALGDLDVEETVASPSTDQAPSQITSSVRLQPVVEQNLGPVQPQVTTPAEPVNIAPTVEGGVPAIANQALEIPPRQSTISGTAPRRPLPPAPPASGTGEEWVSTSATVMPPSFVASSSAAVTNTQSPIPDRPPGYVQVVQPTDQPLQPAAPPQQGGGQPQQGRTPPTRAKKTMLGGWAHWWNKRFHGFTVLVPDQPTAPFEKMRHAAVPGRLLEIMGIKKPEEPEEKLRPIEPTQPAALEDPKATQPNEVGETDRITIDVDAVPPNYRRGIPVSYSASDDTALLDTSIPEHNVPKQSLGRDPKGDQLVDVTIRVPNCTETYDLTEAKIREAQKDKQVVELFKRVQAKSKEQNGENKPDKGTKKRR